jgi:hypothetical protein
VSRQPAIAHGAEIGLTGREAQEHQDHERENEPASQPEPHDGTLRSLRTRRLKAKHIHTIGVSQADRLSRARVTRGRERSDRRSIREQTQADQDC